jgi:putative membrane protein insertion efficiency factor
MTSIIDHTNCDHGHVDDHGSVSPVPVLARGPHRMIRAYQWVFAGRISPCRYEPSCSNYALESLEIHGLFRGSLLSLRRLGRCHPWGGHGWDPVPRKKAA